MIVRSTASSIMSDVGEVRVSPRIVITYEVLYVMLLLIIMLLSCFVVKGFV